VRKKAKDEARKARNDVYRQHIPEAAEEVFAEKGFGGRESPRTSGPGRVLSMGTIYAIFPGKTELLTAILEERGRELADLVEVVARAETPPREALDRLIEVYIGYFVDHPAFLRMHLRSGVSWALGPALATAGQIEVWQEIHRLHAAIFRRGVESGAFVAEDPDFLAKLFTVIDQVLLAEWVAADERRPLAPRRATARAGGAVVLRHRAAGRRAGRAGTCPSPRRGRARATLPGLSRLALRAEDLVQLRLRLGDADGAAT
jgi:AcrR family transcriptional regulator